MDESINYQPVRKHTRHYLINLSNTSTRMYAMNGSAGVLVHTHSVPRLGVRLQPGGSERQRAHARAHASSIRVQPPDRRAEMPAASARSQ